MNINDHINILIISMLFCCSSINVHDLFRCLETSVGSWHFPGKTSRERGQKLFKRRSGAVGRPTWYATHTVDPPRRLGHLRSWLNKIGDESKKDHPKTTNILSLKHLKRFLKPSKTKNLSRFFFWFCPPPVANMLRFSRELHDGPLETPISRWSVMCRCSIDVP